MEKLTLATLVFFSFTLQTFMHPIRINLIHRARIDHAWKATMATYEAALYPRDILFYVNFSIGQPPIPQLAMMDTGSSLLWVPCNSSSKSSRDGGPRYKYMDSFTYQSLPCWSPYCDFQGNFRRDPSSPCAGECAYGQLYGDGSYTTGSLATETLTFSTSDDGLEVVREVVFGCSTRPSDQDKGIFGLGLGGGMSISFASRVSKFAYCIGNVLDHDYPHNRLVLGDEADLDGGSTPIYVHKGHYYIMLERISVGAKMLDINPDVFRYEEGSVDSGGGVFIDSGSAATWLVSEAYDVVTNELKNWMGTSQQQVYDPRYPAFLCFSGNMYEDLLRFPALTFHFAGGAELQLDYESLFHPGSENHFCLTIRESNEGRQSVIGLTAQQNYKIGYDIGGKEKKLYFEKTDCEFV